jgi:hypothetical protein
MLHHHITICLSSSQTRIYLVAIHAYGSFACGNTVQNEVRLSGAVEIRSQREAKSVFQGTNHSNHQRIHCHVHGSLLICPVLSHKDLYIQPCFVTTPIQNYNFACSFVWLWNVVSDVMWRTYTDGVTRTGCWAELNKARIKMTAV